MLKRPDPKAARDELIEIVRSRSFRRGRFTLASGAESEFYFNLKPTMMDPRGAYLAATLFLDVLEDEKAAFVGGLEMGVVPLFGAIAAVGAVEGRPVGTFFVRKKPKDHGTQDLIEGLPFGQTLNGLRVVAADDVATSGGSILKAIEAARAQGAVIDSALVLLDRQQGGTEALAARGVKLHSILKASDII